MISALLTFHSHTLSISTRQNLLWIKILAEHSVVGYLLSFNAWHANRVSDAILVSKNALGIMTPKAGGAGHWQESH